MVPCCGKSKENKTWRCTRDNHVGEDSVRPIGQKGLSEEGSRDKIKTI